MKLINPTDRDYSHSHAGLNLNISAGGFVEISLQDVAKLTPYVKQTFKIFDDGSKLVKLASNLIGLTNVDPSVKKRGRRKVEQVKVDAPVKVEQVKEDKETENKVEVKVEVKVEDKKEEKKGE